MLMSYSMKLHSKPQHPEYRLAGWFVAGVREEWRCLVEKVPRVTGTRGLTSL